MSLVSRMTDFFAASDSSSLASSSGSSSGMGLGGLQDGRLVDVGERMNTTHAQHVEPQEAVRPPYLHVRKISDIVIWLSMGWFPWLTGCTSA